MGGEKGGGFERFALRIRLFSKYLLPLSWKKNKNGKFQDKIGDTVARIINNLVSEEKTRVKKRKKKKDLKSSDRQINLESRYSHSRPFFFRLG